MATITEQKTPAVKEPDHRFVRDDLAESGRFLLAAFGGWLAFSGFGRRSFPGLLTGAFGAALVYRGVTGRFPFDLWLFERAARAARLEKEPGFCPFSGPRNDAEAPDEIEEASMESFPASDAPSYTRG